MAFVSDMLEPEAEVAKTSDGRMGERYLTASETFQLSQAISLKRIADSLARISECSDGIAPSAFRISVQE